MTALYTDALTNIIRQLMIDNTVGVLPIVGIASGTSGSSTDWPIFRDNLPEDPDNLITLNHTTPTLNGRFMTSGQTVTRPGLQVRVRSKDSDVGEEKTKRIDNFFTEVAKQDTVTIGSNVYLVEAFSKTSGPIPLGKSTQDSKRYIFSLNYTISLRVIPGWAEGSWLDTATWDDTITWNG